MELIKAILPFLATFTIFFCGMYLNNLQKSHNDLLLKFETFKEDVLKNYIRKEEVSKIWEKIDKLRDER